MSMKTMSSDTRRKYFKRSFKLCPFYFQLWLSFFSNVGQWMHYLFSAWREVHFLNPSRSSRMTSSKLPGEKKKKAQAQSWTRISNVIFRLRTVQMWKVTVLEDTVMILALLWVDIDYVHSDYDITCEVQLMSNLRIHCTLMI